MKENAGIEGLASLTLNINRKEHKIVVSPDTPLLWVIREDIGLTGTKYGCGISRLRRLHRPHGRKGSPVLQHACF